MRIGHQCPDIIFPHQFIRWDFIPIDGFHFGFWYGRLLLRQQFAEINHFRRFWAMSLWNSRNTIQKVYSHTGAWHFHSVDLLGNAGGGGAGAECEEFDGEEKLPL